MHFRSSTLTSFSSHYVTKGISDVRISEGCRIIEMLWWECCPLCVCHGPVLGCALYVREINPFRSLVKKRVIGARLGGSTDGTTGWGGGWVILEQNISSETSPTCNNCVFILRNGFTLHVSGDNLTHHQEYICCIWPQVSRLTAS